MLFLLALLAFVSLGLPDALLGVAWPTLRRDLGQPLDAMGLVLFAIVSGYLLSSSASGPLARKLGVGGLLVASSLAVVAGNLGIAVAPHFAAVLAGAFVSGLGGGAIDASINAHAAHHFAPGRVVWLHACWGIGAATGSAVMACVVASRTGWRAGYGTVAVAVALLAVGFWATRGRWHAEATNEHHGVTLRESLRRGAVRGNVLLFFGYTGLEAGVGGWAYTLLTEGRGYAAEPAGAAVAGYWTSLTVGRLVGGALAHALSPGRILAAGLGVAPLATLVLAAGPWPLAALAVVGFAIGPVFPLLISATPGRVGPEHVGNAVGFQVAAASVGAAAVPALAGLLGRAFGLPWIGWSLVAVSCVIGALELALRARARG